MAPIKTTLARTVSKLLGVSKNTDLSLRGATQSSRVVIPEGFSASGGNIADGVSPGNGYTYHVFTSSGTFTVNSGEKNVEYLVIGGGGSGGDISGAGMGGGGAGGLRTGTVPNVNSPQTVTIGTGGDFPNGQGTHSVFGPIRSEGGGMGGNGASSNDGYNGGSGGGGTNNSTTGGTANTVAGVGNNNPSTPAFSPQGNNGGGGSGPTSNEGGGGGGGAGGVGQDGADENGGDGGNGAPYPAYAAPLPAFAPMPSPWKTAVGPTGLYAGGGGGGGLRNPSGAGAPGPGGGGSGGASNPSLGNAVSATPGIDFTGGGGGGSAYHPNPDSGNGGDGIVVVRYQPD